MKTDKQLSKKKKTAQEIPSVPTPATEEKPVLEIPGKSAPTTVPAEENKALPQGPAPVATEKNFLKQEVTILQD